MCLYDLVEKDGKIIVVNRFSKRKIPVDEEAYILASMQIPTEEKKEEKSSEP